MGNLPEKLLLHGVSSQLSFKTKCSLCCGFLVTCKLSRIYLNSAQVSVLSHVSLGHGICNGSVDRVGSLNAPESPGKVGNGWGAGAGVVPCQAQGFTRGVLHCTQEKLPLGRWFTAASKISLLKGAFACAVAVQAGKWDGQF